MVEALASLGEQLRKNRRKSGLTLQEVAGKTGLTAGLLSKIENFRTIPSLPVLLNIAGALQLDLAELFRSITVPEKRNWLLIHPGDRRPVEREENRALRYDMILECALPAGRNMQMMYVSIPPETEAEPVTTEADEMQYVLSGHCNYVVGGESVALSPGDTFYFDGRLPHFPDSAKESVTLLCFYFFRENENS